MAKQAKKKETPEEKTFLQNTWGVIRNVVESRSALIKKMLDPRRDLETECGYITDPSPSDYNDMYNHEGVAARVVRLLPEESWHVVPKVFETKDEEETQFEREWNALVKEFNLYAVMARVDVLSGIGRYGIVLLGLDDGEDLAKEAVYKKGRKLLYLRVFDESVLSIKQIERNPSNPRYGRPILYEVQLDAGNQRNKQVIHYSRVIHVADNRRMSEIYGVPRMRPVFNRLQDLRKILGGSAEMFWQGAFPGFAFEINPEVLKAGNAEIDKDSFKEEMQNYINGLQRWFLSEGVTLKTLAPVVADPSSHLEQQYRAIAIALGIPYRIFLGSEEGRLAGSQDERAWGKRITHRQNKYLTPSIVRPFIDRFVSLGIVPEPAEVEVEWPETIELTKKEIAEIAKIITAALKEYVTGGVETVFPIEHFLTKVLNFDQETADAILEAAGLQEEGLEYSETSKETEED